MHRRRWVWFSAKQYIHSQATTSDTKPNHLLMHAYPRGKSRPSSLGQRRVATLTRSAACLPRGGSASATARIEPVGLPSAVARVEGLVGKWHLPCATNAVDAAKATRLHQVN